MNSRHRTSASSAGSAEVRGVSPHTAVMVAVIISLLSSFTAVRGGFAYDAVRLIRDDARLQDPFDLPAFFATEYWNEPGRDSALYRPLTIWSFALGRAVHGPEAWGVHLINVTLGAVLSACLVLMLISITRSPAGAMVGAALFAAHPVHVEVLASGVGRADLGAALACVIGYLMHRRIRITEDHGSGGWRRARLHLLLGGIFFAGLCFKESVIVLPAILFLDDVRRRGRTRWTELARLAIAPALLAIPLGLYLLLRAEVIGSVRLPEIAPILQGASGLDRVLFASEHFLAGVRHLVFPVGIAADYADYRRPAMGATARPGAWAAAAAALAIWLTAGWLWFRHLRSHPGNVATTDRATRSAADRRAGMHALALSILLLAYLPVSNWLFPIGTPGADRLWFIPSIGAALGAAALPWDAAFRLASARLVTAAVLSALTIALTAQSHRLIPTWRSDEALWQRVHAANPGNVAGWMFQGDRLQRQGLSAEAEFAYRRAIELADAAGQLPAAAAVNLAELLRGRGERAQAAELYGRLIDSGSRAYEVFINAGALAYEMDQADEALRLFEAATQREARRVEAWLNLALVLLALDRADDAEAPILRALSLAPTDRRVIAARIDCLRALERHDEAAILERRLSGAAPGSASSPDA